VSPLTLRWMLKGRGTCPANDLYTSGPLAAKRDCRCHLGSKLTHVTLVLGEFMKLVRLVCYLKVHLPRFSFHLGRPDKQILDRLLAPLERSNAFVWTALAVAVVLTLQIEPFRAWGGNEIHYFDLGLRSVRPEQFGANHAAFDHSVARFASFAMLGGAVAIFGYDLALIILRFAAIVAYAIAFAYLARCLKLSRAETLIALMLYVLAGQCYFAVEWMFAGVEGKVFAYAAIFASIGLAWRDRDLAAVGAAALATYLHFLVGGFWAIAVIGLIGLRTGNAFRMGGALLAYSVLCLPILAILLYEWCIAPMPDISDLDLTITQIYSAFRNPHHVAPFSGQLRAWLPGISWMAAAICLLAILARQEHSERRVFARWLLVMYMYLILSFVLSYFDRHTYLLGPLILFRPNSLILLLTIMLGALWLRQALRGNGARTLAIITLAVGIGFGVPRAVSFADTLLFPQLPLTRMLTPNEHALVAWSRDNTPPNATVVIEPTTQTDWTVPWLAFERLIQRPTLVSFKFVPTHKADIARWYRLVRWRKAVFEGECARLSEYPADYLVTLNVATLTRVAACGDIVWTNGTYGVVRIASAFRFK
jgi:Domain of unknown function (DUF6798)